MATCSICSNNITRERFPGVKCVGSCNKLFHIKCARISDDLLQDIKNRSVNWLCEDCRDTSNQSIIEGDDDILVSSNTNISLSDIMIQLKRMEKQLSTFEELKATVTSLTVDNITLKNKVQKLEVQLSNHITKVHQIEADNDKPNQLLNQTKIVITGLPSKHGDIRGVIINTIAKIGIEITADDIVSIETIHINKNDNTRSSMNDKSKLVSKDLLIVNLITTELAYNILTQMRKHKNLTTKDLDVILPLNHFEQRIHIMHRLTMLQSQLYREAKSLKTLHNYNFLWCKNGQIYLRRSTDSAVHRIHSFNDIFRLKNTHQSAEGEDGPARSVVI